MNRHHLLFIAATVALAGCASPRFSCAAPDAKGVVATFQPREQFRSMLERVVSRTQTAAMAANRDGSSAGKNQRQAIDNVVERHGAEWERNTVSGWATLNAEDLKKVCKALNERDQATFNSFANRVGPEIKARNEPLLKRAGVEVLDEIWSRKP
jgi:hypothetical protein